MYKRIWPCKLWVSVLHKKIKCMIYVGDLHYIIYVSGLHYLSRLLISLVYLNILIIVNK